MPHKEFPETIILKGKPNFVEGLGSAEVKPGQIVKLTGENEFGPATPADNGALRIVTENDLVGKTIQDSYPVGEQVYAHIPMPGDVVYGRILAGQAAIAVGASLVRGANGYLTLGTTNPIAEAEVAIDNSGSTEDAFVIARVR